MPSLNLLDRSVNHFLTIYHVSSLGVWYIFGVFDSK
jgi:hypothetical protein